MKIIEELSWRVAKFVYVFYILYSVWIIFTFVLLECLLTVQFYQGFSSVICIVDFFLKSFYFFAHCSCYIYVSRDNIFAFPSGTTLCFTEILQPSGCIIIPVINALNQVPQQYRNCWDILKVLYHWLLLSRSPQKSEHLWKAMQFKANNVFTPAVLLMYCFFDYIFKICQSFPSIEFCIWSYFMELCRPTNYHIQLPTCYSLWVRRKNKLWNLVAFFELYMIRVLK